MFQFVCDNYEISIVFARVLKPKLTSTKCKKKLGIYILKLLGSFPFS